MKYGRLVRVRAAARGRDPELDVVLGDRDVVRRLAVSRSRRRLDALELLGLVSGRGLRAHEVRDAFATEMRLRGLDPDRPDAAPRELFGALHDALDYVRERA